MSRPGYAHAVHALHAIPPPPTKEAAMKHLHWRGKSNPPTPPSTPAPPRMTSLDYEPPGCRSGCLAMMLSAVLTAGIVAAIVHLAVASGV